MFWAFLIEQISAALLVISPHILYEIALHTHTVCECATHNHTNSLLKILTFSRSVIECEIQALTFETLMNSDTSGRENGGISLYPM